MNSDTAARPYDMTRRTAAVERTRGRILDAVVGVFWDGAWSDATLEDVADRAGVTSRTVLRHFGTREGLLEAAMARERQRIEGVRRDAAPGDLDGATRAIVAHYEELGDAVLRVLAHEARVAAAADVAAEGRSRHVEWCRDMFPAALAARDGTDRERLLAQLVAVFGVQTWKSLRRDAELSRSETERAIRELARPLLEVDA